MSATNSQKITIYTTPSCAYCKMAKEFFGAHGIEYEERDVAADENAREEMVAKSHQMGVPVLELGDEIFVGFDKKALAESLHIQL